MNLHTPKPWRFDARRSPAAICGPTDTYEAIARVYMTDSRTNERTTEHEANGLVMTASPELLEACQTALDDLNANLPKELLGRFENCRHLLAAAIHKATTSTGNGFLPYRKGRSIEF